MKSPFSKIKLPILAGIFMLIHASHHWALEISSEEYKIMSEFQSLSQTDLAAAETYLQEALLTTRTSPLLYQAALLEVNKNQIEKAVGYFGEILAIDDQFPGAYKNRGRLYAMNDQPKQAVGDLLNGIKVEGVDKDTLSILNNVYLQLNQPISAELVLRWAILAKPKDPDLYLQLADNLLQQGRFLEARKVSEAAIRLGAKTFHPWVIAANSAIGQNNTKKAIDTLEAARLLHEELPAEYKWTLGELYLRQGFTKQATDLFLEVHKQHTLEDKRLASLLESLIALRDGENAARFAQILIDANPENAKSMYYRARAAELNENLNEAIEYADKATQLDSGFGKAFLLLGNLHLKQENSEKAIDALRIARAFSDLQTQALRSELELWLQTENWSEALSVLEILSQVDTQNSWEALIGSVLDLVHQNDK